MATALPGFDLFHSERAEACSGSAPHSGYSAGALRSFITEPFGFTGDGITADLDPSLCAIG